LVLARRVPQNNSSISRVDNVQKLTHVTDYTLANPDTITKYKVAADISQKVLKEVSGTLLNPAPLTRPHEESN
jgi:hypothetical protein